MDYLAKIQRVVRVGPELGITTFQVQRPNHLASVPLVVSHSRLFLIFFFNRTPLHYVELCSFPLSTIGKDTVSGLTNASSSHSLSTTI